MITRKSQDKVWLILILLLAALMNFWRISQEGFANLYYAASIKSMLMNTHNLFFVSYDPEGFISVDKPPLGFWLQTLSAYFFGFHGWSIIFPQGLAGILSVAMIYYLVKRHWGNKAGLSAAFTLAVMPIAVAANRNNTIDSLLTMTVLFAAWAMIIAVERNENRWLYLSMFILGLAYNIKTLEAFLVLPALWLVYLVAGGRNIIYRLLNLGGATVLLVVVALSWSVLVDLTPESQRPYVGSSETNSELELATGYNGLMHFLGKGVQIPGVTPQNRVSGSGNMGGAASGPTVSNPAGGPGTPGPMPIADSSGGPSSIGDGMASFSFETGNPGILRLFQRQIGGQISWLLPLALIGFFTGAVQRRSDYSSNGRAKTISLLLWGGWLLPQLIFFSIAVDYHRYYLVMMAPALAALVGIALKELFDIFQPSNRNRWFIPLALTLNLAVEAAMVWQFDEWRHWLLPVLGFASIIALSLLLYALRQPTLLRTSMAVAAIAVFIPQVVWALTPIIYGGSSVLPYAGPDLDPKVVQQNGRGMAMPKLASSSNRDADTVKLEKFLIDNKDGEKFILAVGSANEASQFILDTGQAVMAIGGFMGMEQILSPTDFEEMVNEGKVRYVLISSMFAKSQPELNTWITSHGKEVPSELWQEPQPTDASIDAQQPVNAMFALRSRQLFDCAPSK